MNILKITNYSRALYLVFLSALFLHQTNAQTPPLWEAGQFFKYNIEQVMVNVDPSSGKRMVTVLFSVTNPQENNELWDIKSDVPFTQSPALSRLSLLIGWNTKDYQNTGSLGDGLATVPFGRGIAPAVPISIDALKNAIPINGKYLVTVPIPNQAAGTGVAAMEGHPAWPITVNGQLAYAPVPVTSGYQFFSISDPQVVSRRQIVDIKKCQVCHNGTINDKLGEVIPRLTLHGANRTEELQVCVICHNPNQTDIGYRTGGAEVPVDFKTMIHGIHGNKKRQNPLVVIGYRGATNDFGYVEFPGNPRECLKCHVENNGTGTFELPIQKGVLGTTVNTRSVAGSYVDLNPANNLRTTPTAAVCSSCHDNDKARNHIASSTSGGAFAVLQSDIDTGRIAERCVTCHGPGKEKSVRKVHQ